MRPAPLGVSAPRSSHQREECAPFVSMAKAAQLASTTNLMDKQTKPVRENPAFVAVSTDPNLL